MECAKTWDRLSAYLDGDLPEQEREGIAQHLRQCARCAEEGGAPKETLTLLRTPPAGPPPPGGRRTPETGARQAGDPAEGGSPRQAADRGIRPGDKKERDAPPDRRGDARGKETRGRFRAPSRKIGRHGPDGPH